MEPYGALKEALKYYAWNVHGLVAQENGQSGGH
jgi:hypothetical protein